MRSQTQVVPGNTRISGGKKEVRVPVALATQRCNRDGEAAGVGRLQVWEVAGVERLQGLGGCLGGAASGTERQLLSSCEPEASSNGDNKLPGTTLPWKVFSGAH